MRRHLPNGLVVLICLSWFSTHTGLRAEDSDPDLITVSETHWGFDGTIQPRTVVPLSVLVQNVSPSPWQGQLQLTRSAGTGHRMGAVILHKVTLQPDETRWVQLLPYIVDAFDTWTLSWGPDEHHHIQFSNMTKGVRPTVLIYDPDAVTPPAGVLRRMPAELFPTTVTATNGLRGIILNSTPFWQGARARAFLDWLETGGRVYILHNERGVYPQFPAPLSLLNDPREQYNSGSGQVKRIPRKVTDITLEFARREIFNDDIAGELSPRTPANNPTGGTLGSTFASSPDMAVFQDLLPLTTFSRRWWLIYLTVIAYAAALFPGCYWIGVHYQNVRGFYVAFFAASALFSVLFFYLSRLGGSAQNRIRSVAVARSLGKRDYEICQWSYLANVNAGTYTIAHMGSGRCYSTCQEVEAVDGIIWGGPDALIEITMPPASRRTVRHQSRLHIDRPVPRLLDIFANNTELERCSIDVSGCFEHRIRQAAVIFRGRIWDLKVEVEQLQLDTTNSRALTEFLKRPDKWHKSLWGNWQRRKDDTPSQDERYRELFRPLVGNMFGLTNEIAPRRLQMEPDTARILIYVPMSDEWKALGHDFPDQQGCVLYGYDVHVGQ